MSYIVSLLSWMKEEAWEKVDLRSKWREIVETGKEWGFRFVVFAVIWEMIEDGLFPFLAWYFGMAWLIPVFLVWHFEPVVYPIAFFCFRTYDRLMGTTPWEADRPAYSSHKRTVIKVVVYRVAALGGVLALVLMLDLNPWLATAYIVLMTAFNLAHERIWHDSNFGILVETDEVQPRRVIAKALTYRTVSVMLLGGALFAVLDEMHWACFGAYQVMMLALYLGLETAWAKSDLGISGPVPGTVQPPGVV
jgi:hypothetical protein